MSSPPPIPPNELAETIAQPYLSASGDFDDGRRSDSSWKGCVIGCLVVLGACCLLCAGIGYFAYSNFSTWVTQASRQALKATLEESDLPASEQEEILVQFDRVADAYHEGELSLQELGQAAQEIAESPLMGIIWLSAVEAKFLDPSGLSEEEKLAGQRTIARVVRGLVENRFSGEEIETLTDQVLIAPPQGQPNQQPQLKQSLTDEELRSLLADAQELADLKEIPDEDYEVKISELLRDTVDKVLGR